MWNAILYENGQFKGYTQEHGVAVGICVAIAFALFILAKYRFTEEQSRNAITILLGIGLVLQVSKPILTGMAGSFDAREDLPFHLCNAMIILMPFIMYYKWRKFWGIAFFWVIGGTLQALFTPSLTESFPHHEFFRYWTVHAFLPFAGVFALQIYGWRITWKDMVNSMIGLNIFALLVTPINLYLGSNYLFLMAKPAVKTIYDYLGPWPYYILSIEVAMIFLFSLILGIFNLDRLKAIKLKKAS
jgi:hypothetical integral membrane protein (TIGR02206 family)